MTQGSKGFQAGGIVPQATTSEHPLPAYSFCPSLWAEAMFIKYQALVKAGFTEAQAVELCK